MKSKEEILSIAKKNFKPSFLLAWLRFLTYDELKKLDLLEPYDAALSAKQVKSSKDWDNLVISYTRNNLLCGLCILMRKLSNTIDNENLVLSTIYVNDIKNWLYILDDEEYNPSSKEILTLIEITDYYKKVGQKYKIDL